MKNNLHARSATALALLSIGASHLAHADHVQLPPVVVSATTPAEETKRELQAEQALTPGGVTVVDSDELYQRQTANMADMLRYVPGVYSESATGSDGVFISIRGSNLDAIDYDGNGVKLLQDGMPVTAADGNNHNRFVDPLTARYATVARGANAIAYGASTLGGAIDFTTVTALDNPPLDMSINGGSFGLIQSRFSAGKVQDNVDGLVTVEGKHRDGYREHSEQNRAGAHANVGWQVNDRVKNRFYFTFVQNDEELPGGLTRQQWQDDPKQASADAVTGNYQWNVQTQRFANKTTFSIDGQSSVSLGFSYEEQQLYHPIVQVPTYSLLIDTDQRNFGTTLRYNLRAGAHDLVAGLGYGQTRVDGGNYFHNGGQKTALQAEIDNDADSLEAFVLDRWRFAPHWTAVYGVQMVNTGRKMYENNVAFGFINEAEKDYSSINPRAGLIYHLGPESELFANISKVYEAPTLYQFQDQVGDTLDAMNGIVYEIGTRGTQKVGKGSWRWDVAVYYTRLRDEILSVDDPGQPGRGENVSFNADRTTHAGIEALLGGSFPIDETGKHRIEPLVSMTLNHFRFDSDPLYGNNKLPAAPPYAVRGEVLYRNGGTGFFFGPTFDFVGTRYADLANSYEIDAYTLWGLRTGVVRKDWELYAEIRNLANEKYIARHGVDAISPADADILYPGEPRSAYVGLRLMY